MVEIKNLSAGYSSVPVLNDVSFSAAEGQVTVLLGPNGCGKSTLLKSLCGILPIRNGDVLVDGCSVLELEQKQLAQKIAYLPQDRPIPQISVGRMVLHGRFPYLSYPRRYRAEDYAAADRAMAQIGILDLADCPMHTLSGGQRQMLAIARAIMADPKLIICDEIHNLLKFQYFCHRPNYHSIARSGLENAVKGGSATVIALTATPNTISNEFHAPAVEIPIDQTELIHYEVGQTVCYTNLDAVLSEVEVGSMMMPTFGSRALMISWM